jgi:hypothetical protein
VALTSGSKLGPYEILGPVGAGGDGGGLPGQGHPSGANGRDQGPARPHIQEPRQRRTATWPFRQQVLTCLPEATRAALDARSLVCVDRTGALQPLGAHPRPYSFPTPSPDGEREAVAIAGVRQAVWIYDISPDGQRFLFVQENEPLREPTPLVVVLNRFEEPKRRVPVN